jgi:polyhydroxyalkanoate synthesis repressor PhaR
MVGNHKNMNSVENNIRIIKKYPNRRLYDETDSRYINFSDLHRMILDGKEFKVLVDKTNEDQTLKLMLQIFLDTFKNKKTKPETYEAIKGHEVPLKTYINHTVRTGTRPNVEGFMNHYIKSQQKKVDSVKTEKAKATKTADMETAIGHVQRNRAHFEAILNQHKALQKAKNVLTNTLSSNSEFDHSINGKKAKPEGFVVVRHNRPTKFVDRAEFSAANFNRGKPA